MDNPRQETTENVNYRRSMREHSMSDEFSIVPVHEDDQIVRWVALGLIDGRKETEIKSEVQNMRINSQLDRKEWNALIRRGREMAGEMTNFIMSKAELSSTDYLRLDSYQRRKRMMARLEGLINSAVEQSDSVSKMNSTSFMIGGLLKAQNDMDAFTGAKEAAPQVQINIGYDPMDQFREVIQSESEKILDVEYTSVVEEE